MEEEPWLGSQEACATSGSHSLTLLGSQFPAVTEPVCTLRAKVASGSEGLVVQSLSRV